MHVLIPVILLLLIIFGPSLWVSWVLKRYSAPRDDFPGTGGEFAKHLIDRLKLTGVGAEITDLGDHYAPDDRMVRLSKEVFNGRSLTAVTVAAHEVGHALQHHLRYKPLEMRSQVAVLAHNVERMGAMVMFAIPIITAITRAPASGLLLFAVGLFIMSLSVIAHFATLPVEFDASFKRALPILEAGNYLNPRDMRAARKILLAAALTYVAASLMGLLNIWRWFALFRR